MFARQAVPKEVTRGQNPLPCYAVATLATAGALIVLEGAEFSLGLLVNSWVALGSRLFVPALAAGAIAFYIIKKRADLIEQNPDEVSKRESLEEELRLSQRLESVGRLAGGIAHDFNNMLTAINGYSDLTLRQLGENDPLRRNIEEIRRAGQRSAVLTNQLLAYSRKQILRTAVFDLNTVVAEAEKAVMPLLGESIALKLKPAAILEKVNADRGQIRQVVMNLVLNARDAMPKGGALTIETANVYLGQEYCSGNVGARPGNFVMLAVSDTGVGVSREEMKHIFEPFFTTKEPGKGTGLGLAMVYGIVKQSGGHIRYHSDLGIGSTFKIYLPAFERLASSL